MLDPTRWQLMTELYRRLSPPRSVSRAGAILFEQTVRRVIDESGAAIENLDHSAKTRHVGVDYVVRVGGQKVVIEAKYAVGANRVRRLREAFDQVAGALEQLDADRGFVVVPERLQVRQSVDRERIHVVTPEELRNSLLLIGKGDN